MNAIGANSERDIDPRVDQQTRPAARIAKPSQRFPCKQFQLAASQVALAQLHVIDSRRSGLANLFQQAAAARSFVRPELRAVGDVVKLQANSLAALPKRPSRPASNHLCRWACKLSGCSF